MTDAGNANGGDVLRAGNIALMSKRELQFRLDEALRDVDRLQAALSDPIAVHANMLRGTIAKPSPGQIVHIYGVEALLAEIATHTPPTPEALTIPTTGEP